MRILETLGIKAVGLKKQGWIAHGLRWLFGSSRTQYRPVFSFGVVCVCLTLMYGSYTHMPGTVACEHVGLTLLAPILGVSKRFQTIFQTVSAYAISQKLLLEKNAHLHAQNDQILRENLALKQQAFLTRDILQKVELFSTHTGSSLLKGAFSGIIINTIGTGGSLLVQHDNTDMEHAIVVGARGIVGRVAHVGHTVSKITTLLDPTFSIPVHVAGIQAIAKGQGSASLILTHMQQTTPTPPKVGDVVYTSGFGGVYPKALPVGTVTSAENKSIEVTPFEDIHTIHTVILIPSIDANSY